MTYEYGEDSAYTLWGSLADNLDVHQADTARRRLIRDFKALSRDPPSGVSGAPLPDNILLWNAVIFGPRQCRRRVVWMDDAADIWMVAYDQLKRPLRMAHSAYFLHSRKRIPIVRLPSNSCMFQ